MPEAGIEMPEGAKDAAAEGELVVPVTTGTPTWAEVAGVAVRVACLVASLVAMSVMVTSEQHATLSVYGFRLPVHSKWSFSESSEFLVGVAAVVAAHTFLQLILGAMKMLKKSPLISSRNHAWILFAADQVLAYAMMSAGSAAAGVTNLNRTGIRHSALPDFCKPLKRFCDHMTASITFSFITCVMLVASVVLDVIWLSQN